MTGRQLGALDLDPQGAGLVQHPAQLDPTARNNLPREGSTMADKSTDLQRQVEQLQADNEQLRGQLAATGARPASVAPQLPQITEGQRLELEGQGWTTIRGVVYTSDEVKALLPALHQEGVSWAEPSATAKASAAALVGRLRVDADTLRQGVRGVDYVWPSVERGGIDPAVAGTPGISGPAAGSDEQRLLQTTPAANVGTPEASK